MNYLESSFNFSSLSTADLLAARDQFHVHLMNKPNVVGTAVGRYLIRRDTPWPTAVGAAEPPPAKKASPKMARTLENSEVRDYSWPCVLVFVSEWRHAGDFGADKDLPASGFIPKTIYLADGRSVPICVVLTSRLAAAPAIDAKTLKFPTWQISGGYPVVAEVQKGERIASIGCLVTDGHRIYAITNRHVAGRPGEEISTYLGKKKTKIGITSDKQLSKKKFSDLYPGWCGKDVYVNMDIGLVEVTDERQWNPAVFGLGALGPLADLNVYNLGVQIVGCPVRAFGAVGGRMTGQVAALFYRYKSVGGFEYVADFLIGSRDEAPLQTRPGDSGTLWAVETDTVQKSLLPLAIQWGGTVLSAGDTQRPYVLATNLSAVCRELDVDLFRSKAEGGFEYWGVLGHYTIGALACGLAKDKRLRDLMLANQDRVSFKPADLKANVEKVKVANFVPLADVPDKVWKVKRSEQAPYGRKGNENPNHYADLDLDNYKGQRSLDFQTPDAASLKVDTWKNYYHAIGFTKVSQRGLLPFRVWQIYKQLVDFVRQKDVEQYVCAAGVLAHYIGDACQTLHGSYMDDGDAFRKPDGSPSADPLPHGTAWGNGVHAAYEDTMLDKNVDDLLARLPGKVKGSHGKKLITGGNAAGYATIELMRRTRKKVKPVDVVKAYTDIPKATRGKEAPGVLWTKFGTGTLGAMADGCKTLAMIWESAWVEGNGDKVPASSLKAIDPAKLRTIYERQDFLPSVALGQIQQHL